MRTMKGQAAVEYLMTHGWTILTLTAILILLYSMGMFSPSKYLRQDCYFQPDLPCSSFRLSEGDSTEYALFFSLNNGLGFDILVEEVNVTATGLGTPGEVTHSKTCLGGICTPAPGLVRSGEILNVTFPIGKEGALPGQGSLQQLKVSIAYRNCRTAPGYSGSAESCQEGSPHIVSGKISANIE